MKLTPVQWEEIRTNVISGRASAESEARRVGVAPSCIRRKSLKEGWSKSHRDALTREATKSWLEKAEEHRQRMFAMATNALSKASLPPPKNWRDAETADKIARRAAGLEDGEQGRQLVQIALLGRGPEPAEIYPV
jgi:hypothetical protein